MKSEDSGVDVDMTHFNKGFEPTKNINHIDAIYSFGFKRLNLIQYWNVKTLLSITVFPLLLKLKHINGDVCNDEF